MRLCFLPHWIRRPCAPQMSRASRIPNWLWKMRAPPVRGPRPRRQRPRVFIRPQRRRAISSRPLLLAPRIRPPAPRSRRVLPKPVTRIGNPLGKVSGNLRSMAIGNGRDEDIKGRIPPFSRCVFFLGAASSYFVRFLGIGAHAAPLALARKKILLSVRFFISLL